MTTQQKTNIQLKGKILRPAELINYSRDSIVSQTLVDHKAGTLTLFAFDRGQGLSEHVAPYDAVVEILEGEAMITIAGRSLKVKSGAFVIMPANVPPTAPGMSPPFAVFRAPRMRRLTRPAIITWIFNPRVQTKWPSVWLVSWLPILREL
jgi:hypothetical protein